MAVTGHKLGIDFGTSNSAAGYLVNGRPELIEMRPAEYTLPTTFFFDYETRQTFMGETANQALLNGEEGRFMRALKRVLGTGLMYEKRQILNERLTFVDIISRFLAHIKSRAEAQAGHVFDHVISGRPVVFHGLDDPREKQAEADLRACYLAAGFKDVSFLAEPQAAAIASGALEQAGETGLIVDIGGGTSDFSLFRSGAKGIEILANHGVRIGGTDFDRSLNIACVMPLLGKGGKLHKLMGEGHTPVPAALFNDLATWEKIPFQYTAQNRRMVSEMLQLAYEPHKIQRLLTVLDDELGHALAFAVEKGKITANSGRQNATIALDDIETGLKTPLSQDQLTQLLTPHTKSLSQGVQHILQQSGVAPRDVSQVVYVGGSSLMEMVTNTMKSHFPQARHSFSEVFTAVTNGLALATARS